MWQDPSATNPPRAGVVVNEVDPDGAKWAGREKTADRYVDSDGTVWDRKPTWFNRLLKRGYVGRYAQTKVGAR